MCTMITSLKNHRQHPFVAMTASDHRISVSLRALVPLLADPDASQHLSPQLARRLSQVLICWEQQPANSEELTNRITALYNRLLLELVQAQYNTKQREQDLIRLIESKGCSIRDPDLIDQVTELLIRLYKAAGQCNDTSFERQVLIKYILKEQDVAQQVNSRKRQIERVVQTIYKCSCFHITQQNGAPSRLSLKEELYDASKLRQQLDTEIIRMAQTECIRLSPDSWAYLLHGRSTPASVARLQPLIDRFQTPVYVDELAFAIRQSGDKMSLEHYLGDLYEIEDLIKAITIKSSSQQPQQGTIVDNEGHCYNLMGEILDRLASLKYLFTVRQRRAKLVSG